MKYSYYVNELDGDAAMEIENPPSEKVKQISTRKATSGPQASSSSAEIDITSDNCFKPFYDTSIIAGMNRERVSSKKQYKKKKREELVRDRRPTKGTILLGFAHSEASKSIKEQLISKVVTPKSAVRKGMLVPAFEY